MANRTINPKEEYNKYRKILLSNIPPSTEGEIREFLGVFKAKKIIINDSLDSALVTLINGNQVDEAVGKLNNKQFKDNIVSVKSGLNGNLVSIAHIPLTYTDINFREFCRKFGQVEYSYILRAAGNGLSKGYGLVEFNADNEQIKQIKSEIDWHSLEGQTLHADFVSESYQTWEGLQSRCLLINNMPEDFVDVSKLRETFSCVTSPVYCQIIAKGDKSLGFGIVEFRTSEDAEQTWIKLKNEKISGKPVIMTFCIPGKSAVVINNRIMWKYGDKLQKTSSLLPDPVSAKPVIAGNPIVISLTKHNPKLMEDFTSVLGELQQAYVSQMMSPENKPDGSCPFKTGLLGPAPSLPLSPMMNPNMQLGLLVMLALHIQATKKEQFTGVLAKQLNTLSEQEGSENQKFGPRPSILGDPLTGQANVILTSLKQQLNQVPLTGENGKQLEEPKTQDGKIRLLVKKFVTNGRFLNLGLLSNLGQLLVNMKHSDVGSHDSGNKGQSLLGPMPGNSSQIQMHTSLGKGASLLGDPPSTAAQPLQSASIANANATINSSIMQAMGLNVGSGSSMGTMGQTLLSQISQGLVHQIGQNILYQMTVSQAGQGEPGRGLLGDVPKENNQKSKRTAATNKALLGDAPVKSGQSSSNTTSTSLDQGTWKTVESRKRMEMSYDNNTQMDRWGSSSYDNSGYGSKGGMGTSGNEYGYGNDAYGDMSGSGGQYAGYGDGTSDYYNYQSQYGYGGQTDNTNQTESNYSQQYGSGYGMGGSDGMNNNAAYGMNAGYEGHQSSGGNYQDGQVYGKGGDSGLGQDSGKYGSDGYGGNMSGAGYGYDGRNDQGNGYSSYNVSEGYSGNVANRMGSGGMGNSHMGSNDGMGSGGMGGSFMGGGMMGMGVGGVGTGGMDGGGMGGGGMGGGGMGGGGGGAMGSGEMGGGFMGSGGMGSGGMSGGFMGGGAMGSGSVEGGGMGGERMGGGFMGSGSMGGGAMGSGGMGGGGMGSGSMGGGAMESGGMGGGAMGSGSMGGGAMGSGGMGGGAMGSGGMGGGAMGSGSMGNDFMGRGGMGSRVAESGGMGNNGMGTAFMGSGNMVGGGMDSSNMGSGGVGGGFMGSGGVGSGFMGSGGVGSGFMGSGGMGRDQKGNGSMNNSMIRGGGMDGNSMVGTGSMGSGSLDNSGGGGSGFMMGGMRGSGNMGGENMGSGGMSNSSNSSAMLNALVNAFSTGGMGGTGRSGMGSGGGGLLGNPVGNNFGGGMTSGSGSMGGSGISGRDNTAFFTGIGGSSNTKLLSSSSKYMSMSGQKRDHSQMMAQSDMNVSDSSNFMGQQSQGRDGHYGDILKKNRLF